MRAIDADALIEKCGDWYTEESSEEGYIGTIKGIVDVQPTIKPEQKKGKWLPDNNSVYEMRFVCSECKTAEVVPTIGFTKYEPIWDFCPNCGADLRGE